MNPPKAVWPPTPEEIDQQRCEEYSRDMLEALNAIEKPHLRASIAARILHRRRRSHFTLDGIVAVCLLVADAHRLADQRHTISEPNWRYRE